MLIESGAWTFSLRQTGQKVLYIPNTEISFLNFCNKTFASKTTFSLTSNSTYSNFQTSEMEFEPPTRDFSTLPNLYGRISTLTFHLTFRLLYERPLLLSTFRMVVINCRALKGYLWLLHEHNL